MKLKNITYAHGEGEEEEKEMEKMKSIHESFNNSQTIERESAQFVPVKLGQIAVDVQGGQRKN